jgi:hypothetical protein
MELIKTHRLNDGQSFEREVLRSIKYVTDIGDMHIGMGLSNTA